MLKIKVPKKKQLTIKVPNKTPVKAPFGPVKKTTKYV